MGILVRRVSGKSGWWVIWTHKKQRKTWKFHDQKAAQTHAKAIERKHAEFLTRPPSSLTLSAYFERWLTEHVALHRKPATVDQYTIAYTRYIKPLLGDRPLASITRADVRSLIVQMASDKKSTATMRAYLAPLSAMMGSAIEDELIAKNPVYRQLPKPRLGLQGTVAKVLTAAQLSHLLTVCYKLEPRHYPFILTLARTGMRVGEVTALRWPQVDLTAQTIAVQRTHRESKWGREAQEIAYAPKSGKYRTIPISAELTAVLRLWHTARNPNEPRVFTSTRGTALDLANFRKRAWRRLLTAAEVPPIRLHDIRHTVATLLLEADVPLVKVKEILGHHSIKITADLYGHLESGKYHSVVNVLDEGAPGAHGARKKRQKKAA